MAVSSTDCTGIQEGNAPQIFQRKEINLLIKSLRLTFAIFMDKRNTN